jgi:hypothetical protein
MTTCIGQLSHFSHFSQIDWSKNTCFMPLIKLDMSIIQKILVSQLEPFEKPCFIVEDL